MMMLEPLRFPGLRGELRANEPLSRHTSWRCGGAADVAFVPADREDFATFVRQLPAEEPVTVIGLGSNLLVRDGGVRGTVVLLHAALNELGFDGSRIRAEAGVASPKVSRYAAMHDRADAEFLSGIPGTIGGALAMNAGCYGGETWRDVAEVEVLTRQGGFERRPPEAYVIGYRSVVSRRGADDIAFTAAWFDFPPGNGAYARGRIKALLTQRIATQPLGLPNAGSVFRNPEGDHAARLIESCGLKGFAIGGARVSEKHANFIVNAEGLATAADVEALIGHVRAVVRRETGVDLEQEVRIIGEAR
ncbi:MAG TPA: UDP-N-acetylmuramate dehydrogenase [Casimicrobiaceae bacterium]|jgi:UDP-N-acetylmuramate dehydrogenase|nr:UDP-N-acetylmuramate dehydrogenase [Casimicrobiaceae bacterium]